MRKRVIAVGMLFASLLFVSCGFHEGRETAAVSEEEDPEAADIPNAGNTEDNTVPGKAEDAVPEGEAVCGEAEPEFQGADIPEDEGAERKQKIDLMDYADLPIMEFIERTKIPLYQPSELRTKDYWKAVIPVRDGNEIKSYGITVQTCQGKIVCFRMGIYRPEDSEIKPFIDAEDFPYTIAGFSPVREISSLESPLLDDMGKESFGSSKFFSEKPVKSRLFAIFIPKIEMGLGLTFGAEMGYIILWEVAIMAYKERINSKTGKKEYKVRYYFMREGKKRDSETAWFDTLEKAEKEAKKQKELKEKEDRNNITQRRDKKLVTAYEEFISYLKKLSDEETSNTNKKEYQTANAIYNNHMPQTVKETRIKDISVFTFRSWLSHINSKDTLGGGYVRLCRMNLIKFNIWLSQNGYYVDEYQEETLDIGIRKTKIKSALVNNRERKGERNIISILDIQEITRYYTKQEYGLGEFRNFYFYTLFFVLFFSGMRVEELTGLQWKFIDLREGVRTISIKNAISKMEKVESALERTMKGQYRTKNTISIRTIPIFDFYYELLIDYKESFRYEYGLTKEEIEECFVFPNIDQNNPHRFMRSDQTLRELKKVLDYCNMENTDLQMFRHSCATFLVLPPPEGLGYSEEKIKDYFGHQDTKMLNKIYARLNEIQKADRMRRTFSDIYKPDETAERTAEEEMKNKLISRISGNNKREKYAARIYRIHNQIRKAMLEGKKKYYYRTKDKKIIELYIKENGNTMEFIETD